MLAVQVEVLLWRMAHVGDALAAAYEVIGITLRKSPFNEASARNAAAAASPRR